MLHHDFRIGLRAGASTSNDFRLRFLLTRHAHDGGRNWYLLRVVAVLHLHRGISAQDTGNLAANMNGRTGLSPIVTGARVHRKLGFRITLLDLIEGSKNIRTTAVTVRIDEENYGQISGVKGGRNDFMVSFSNLGNDRAISWVELRRGTCVYVTSTPP